MNDEGTLPFDPNNLGMRVTRPGSEPPLPPQLPYWWGILEDNYGKPGTISYHDIKFPISGAIAPDKYLPVCYGQVRIGGTAIKVGGASGFDDMNHGWGVIAWAEGEIESLDTFYVNGRPLVAFTADQNAFGNSLGINHYVGDGTQATQDATSQIFCPAPRTNPGVGSSGPYDTRELKTASYTYFEAIGSIPHGQFWWWLLDPSRDLTAPDFEWAADIHGKKCYDPRTATVVYTTNPIIIARDILVTYGKATVDDVQLQAVANASDAAGFSCNIAFATRTDIKAALAIVLQTCNGTLITSNGKVGISLDVVNASAAALTVSEEAGDIWGLTYEWISARDRVTSVIVQFDNRDANYTADQTPPFTDPGVALGTVPLREVSFQAPGINTLAAAIILRDYTLNSQAVTFRVMGTMSAIGITLAVGQKIAIKTLKAIDADFLITQITGDGNGFFQFVAKPYFAAVYGTVPVLQGPPVTNPPFGVNPGTPYLYIRDDSAVWPTTAKLRWDLRATQPTILWGAAFWSFSTPGSSHTPDASKVNDGDTSAIAFGFDGIGTNSLTMDTHASGGADREFIGVRLIWPASVVLTDAIVQATLGLIRHSPDNITYTTTTDREGGIGPSSTQGARRVYISGVWRGVTLEWNAPGAFRYWQYFYNTAGTDANRVWTEVQFIESDSATSWVDGQIDRYEIHARTSAGECTEADPTVLVIAGRSRPLYQHNLDLRVYTYQDGTTDTFGNLLDFLNCFIVAVPFGGRGVGFPYQTSGFAYIASGAAGLLPLVDISIIGTPSTGFGGVAIDSASGDLYKVASGGAWTPVGGGGGSGTLTLLRNGSGITGTINDVNTVFTTSANVSAATGGYWVIVDGIEDLDATWVGTTLTASTAPHSGIAVRYLS